LRVKIELKLQGGIGVVEVRVVSGVGTKHGTVCETLRG
jgi:hypothetical protein